MGDAMKFGIHAGLWMARWTDDIAPILRTVADLGFDGVEISLLGMTDEKASALAGLIRDHGLEVTCSDGLSKAADITSADPAVRAAGQEHLQWAIRTVAMLGGRGLAGVIYAPWGVFDPDNKAVRSQRSAEMLGRLHDDLVRHDVTLGIEAINRFETDLVNSAAEASALARGTGSDRIGVLLDTFHLNIEEKDVRSAIAASADSLVHFHVSDNDRGVPGSGHVPWAEVAAGLKDVAYDRWIVAEMFVKTGTPAGNDLNIWRDIEPEATNAAAQALSFMRKTFEAAR
jgi:D-psicose/D-tagatose/L-ribulose 3-epimerase